MNINSEQKEEVILEPIKLLEEVKEVVLEPIPVTQFIIETAMIELEKTILSNISEELTQYIKSIIGEYGIITSLNIIAILNNLIHNIEKYNTLKGTQKKMLILDTLKKVINEQYGNNPEQLLEKQLLFILIDNTMPQVIDTLISAINGEIKFIKSKENNLFTVLKNLFTSIKQKFSCKTKNKK